MRSLYGFLVRGSYLFLWGAQLFSPKMKRFVQGRKDSFAKLESGLSSNDKVIWMHCASLGEFEQGVPVIEAVKKRFPDHKFVITFFSPSGYEIKKNTPLADVVIYLPLDTRTNAVRFLDLAKPKLAIFVKYEFWPNYLFELKKRNVPTILISGLFRPGQLFFKPHGGFMRKALRTIDHFFVQNDNSKALLQQIGFTNVTISGDTRFDRVSHQIEMDNSLDFMDAFANSGLCIVCGSTWPEDEAVLLPFINGAGSDCKFVIAPHKIDDAQIAGFRKKCTKSVVLYSELADSGSADTSVLIIDTIGLLSRIYSYADIAYVGGAMGTTGLHNILEPATFGIPVVIGKNFEKFPEAIRLRQLAGLYSVSSAEECTEVLTKLTQDKDFRSKTGMISGHFVNSNTGATQTIMNHLEELHGNGLI